MRWKAHGFDADVLSNRELIHQLHQLSRPGGVWLNVIEQVGHDRGNIVEAESTLRGVGVGLPIPSAHTALKHLPRVYLT